MDIHTIQSFLFIFYRKKIWNFFSQKYVNLEKKITTTPFFKNLKSKKIQKNQKIPKKLQWVLSKKKKKRGGKFCPHKNLDTIL